MGDNPTYWGRPMSDLNEDELRAMIENISGEQQASLNAMWRQVNRQQEQLYNLRLEVEQLKAERRRTLIGSIEGLEGEFSVTPVPRWTE